MLASAIVLSFGVLQLMDRGVLVGEVIVSSGLEDTRIGSGHPFLSVHNLSANTSRLFAAYQADMLTSATALDERFLIGEEAVVINTPSKFATFGSRHPGGYVGKRLFDDAYSEVHPVAAPPDGASDAASVPSQQGTPPSAAAPSASPARASPAAALPMVRSFLHLVVNFMLGRLSALPCLMIAGHARVRDRSNDSMAHGQFQQGAGRHSRGSARHSRFSTWTTTNRIHYDNCF